MIGNSPMSPTQQELLHYYNTLSPLKKMEHMTYSDGLFLLIGYRHVVEERVAYDDGLIIVTQEIVDADEGFIINLETGSYM